MQLMNCCEKFNIYLLNELKLNSKLSMNKLNKFCRVRLYKYGVAI